MVLIVEEDVPFGNDGVDGMLLVTVRLPVAGTLVKVTLEAGELGRTADADKE